jgi:hypothetical protein
MSPLTMALIGYLGAALLQGKGKLAEMLGRHRVADRDPRSGRAAGRWCCRGILSGRLSELLREFQQNGQGAQSALSTGQAAAGCCGIGPDFGHSLRRSGAGKSLA